MFGYMELSIEPFLCGCADFRTDATGLPFILDSMKQPSSPAKQITSPVPTFFFTKYIYFSGSKM